MPTNKDTPATPTAFSKTWLNTLTPQLPKQPETQEQATRMEIVCRPLARVAKVAITSSQTLPL